MRAYSSTDGCMEKVGSDVLVYNNSNVSRSVAQSQTESTFATDVEYVVSGDGRFSGEGDLEFFGEVLLDLWLLALAFSITLSLSFRNDRSSMFRYPGHSFPNLVH